MNPDSPTRCGFVAVVGAPNVGKSTLINQVVGAKVSIVSPKVQTTRTRVMGICIQDQTQVVFIDTPGIFEPRRRLDRAMVAAAWSGAADADMIIHMVDSTKGIDSDTQRIIQGIRKQKRTNVILVLNKVDRVKKPKLLDLAAALGGEGVYADTFMISALTGDGTNDLMTFLGGRMADGPWMFPEDQISDMPQRLLAAEITREKLYLQLRNELPYAATVETESWEDQRDGSIRISQVIVIERASQKGIVVGKGGTRIKALGEAARHDLEEMFACRVHLFLFVKVRERWGDDRAHYRDWGLDFNA
jgi:GTPase